MKTLYGTMDEHKGTIERARAASGETLTIWSGDIRRNRYLAENLEVMKFLGVADITFDDSDDQESNFIVTWRNK